MNALSPREPLLGSRASGVLAELMERFLADGVPVASRTIAGARREAMRDGSRDGWSPASIRNIMAELEEQGYLQQPHTSAGRVPTPKATRWWIDQLSPPPPLPMEQTQELERALQAANDDVTLWTRAAEFLARLSHQCGVAGIQPWTDTGMREIRFIRLTEHRVLALLVATDGSVRERVGRLPEAYAQNELDAAARYFNLHFPGATLTRIRHELARRLQEERAAYDALLKRVLVLYHCGLLEMQDRGALYVQGASRMGEEMGPEKLAALLERLGEKERWLQLLHEIGAAHDEVLDWDAGGGLHREPAVRVRVGLDQADMPEYSLVTTTCRLAEHGEGVIGVVGPTRMQYAQALRAVAHVRHSLQRVMGTS